MKANQVAIVMDRGSAEVLDGKLTVDGPFPDNPRLESAVADLRAALDRDPDELEARIARALDPSAFDEWAMTDGGLPMVMKRTAAKDQARAVLHALQEGGPE